MKKLIIAMSAIAFALTSCQKENIVPQVNTPNETQTTDANLYYNGTRVSNQHEITSTSQTSIVITDQLDGKLSYYFFDNNDQAETFVNQHSSLSKLQTQLANTKKIRAYAESINEDAYVTEHGINSNNFTTYVNQHRDRPYPFALFTGTNFMGTSFGVLGPTPILVPAINNLSNSMRSGDGLPINHIMYDLINFNPAAGSVFIAVAGVPVLGGFGWAARISSVN